MDLTSSSAGLSIAAIILSALGIPASVAIAVALDQSVNYSSSTNTLTIGKKQYPLPRYSKVSYVNGKIIIDDVEYTIPGITYNTTTDKIMIKGIDIDTLPAYDDFREQMSGKRDAGHHISVGVTTTGQGSNSVSVGSVTESQGDNAIAIGYESGKTEQGVDSIAIGHNAGNDTQGKNSIAIGIGAGFSVQKQKCIAIGYKAGYDTQEANSVAIGNQTGRIKQATNSVAIGNNAGNTSQDQYSVAIGNNAGYSNQKQNSVAIGNTAGFDTQGINCVAVGYDAGNANQEQYCVAIGDHSGYTGQGEYSVAIGKNAGYSSQKKNSVAVGADANVFANGDIALGYSARTAADAKLGFGFGDTVNPTTTVSPGAINTYLPIRIKYDGGEYTFFAHGTVV